MSEQSKENDSNSKMTDKEEDNSISKEYLLRWIKKLENHNNLILEKLARLEGRKGIATADGQPIEVGDYLFVICRQENDNEIYPMRVVSVSHEEHKTPTIEVTHVGGSSDISTVSLIRTPDELFSTLEAAKIARRGYYG